MKTTIIKILSSIFCLVICLCLIPAAFADGGIIDSGNCGDDLTWTLDDEGTLIISGTGEMAEYPQAGTPWHKYRSVIRKAVFDNRVTNIGRCTFCWCDQLISVVIPDHLTSIGDQVFRDCNRLSSITIPDSVTSIGELAFYGCYNLPSISIPESVNYIGRSAFMYCKSLSTITIPEGVTKIEDETFYGCNGLNTIIIPDSVNYIGGRVFNYCPGLTTAGLIGSGSNIEFGWTDVIPFNAFSSCDSLTSISMPSTITKIGSYAFQDCNISDVYYCGSQDEWDHISGNDQLLNATIHYIPHQLVFRDEQLPTCLDDGHGAYWTCELCNRFYNNEAGTEEISAPIVIPLLGHSMEKTELKDATCTEVGYEAYWTCDRCNKTYSDEAGTEEISAPIVIPLLGHSMIKTEKKAQTCTEIGYEAYWTCDRCNKIYSDEAGAAEISAPIVIPALGHTPSTPVRENEVAPSILNLGRYDEVVYCSVCQAELSRELRPIEKIRSGDCEDNLHWRLSEVGNENFELLLSPSDLVTAASVTNSAAWSEVKDFITKVTFEKGITDIGDSAFSDYSNLGQVTLADSLRTIGDNAFNNCKNLKSLNLNNSLLSIGSYFIKGTSITEMTIPDSVSNVSDGAFTGLENNLYASIGKDGAKAIGNAGYSFRDKQVNGFVFRYSGDDLILISCDSTQRTVSVPRGVTHIEENAFQNNTRLSTVTLPGTVKDIGDRAFSNCSRLSTIHLPYGLLSIGQYAFDSCVSLSTLNVPYSVTNIGASAFSYCTSLTLDVYKGSQAHVYAVHNNIPYTLAYESEAPFGTPDFTLPQRLSEISEEAFMGVPATCIELSSDVNTIQNSAFEDCFQLRQIYIPSSVSYISPSAFNGTTGLVIYGVAGSYAEDYAYDNGFGFIERQ